MATTDAARGQVAAAAAEVYEEFFVPALFGQWAAPMLDAAGVAAGDAVLDVGCGTGVVARAAARRVGPTGEVVGLDRNDGMLAVAARSLEPVTWRQGVAERLPFDDGRFDRVLCQFAVMYFDDQRQGLREMARVLRPGGTVAIATWSAVEESPGYASMVDLLRRVVSDEAADALLAPFTLGTAKVVAELLADVFPDAAVTRHQGTARFESIRSLGPHRHPRLDPGRAHRRPHLRATADRGPHGPCPIHRRGRAGQVRRPSPHRYRGQTLLTGRGPRAAEL